MRRYGKAGNLKEQAYWVQDCSAATQNIAGRRKPWFGCCLDGSLSLRRPDKVVIETLNLPENHIPLNVIPIGYPTGEDAPKDKWKPENIIWDKQLNGE